MAAVDLEEYKRLQDSVLEVERLLAGSPHRASSVLENFLQNARKRLEVLKREIKEEQEKQQAAAVAAAVERETALSEREQQTFAGFLRKDFFTKQDFVRLELFYAESWDRLTEAGKDEMSQRVWAGIRRGECEFSELPITVQNKEAERLRDLLVSREKSASETKIPQNDRDDFIRAFQRGEHEEVRRILGRKSFQDNVAVGTAHSIEHNKVQQGLDTENEQNAKQAVLSASTTAKQTSLEDAGSRATLDLNSIDLSGLQVTEGPIQKPVAGFDRGSQSIKTR